MKFNILLALVTLNLAAACGTSSQLSEVQHDPKDKDSNHKNHHENMMKDLQKKFDENEAYHPKNKPFDPQKEQLEQQLYEEWKKTLKANNYSISSQKPELKMSPEEAKIFNDLYSGDVEVMKNALDSLTKKTFHPDIQRRLVEILSTSQDENLNMIIVNIFTAHILESDPHNLVPQKLKEALASRISIDTYVKETLKFRAAYLLLSHLDPLGFMSIMATNPALEWVMSSFSRN